MSSGVRNLRAMFENKETSNSPPDRGRSPSSLGPPSNTTSPRPLSKVRTSFVMVEKNGQIGLQFGAVKKDTGPDDSTVESTVAKRRNSFSEDQPSQATRELKEPIKIELEERKKSIAVDEVIPEAAVETPLEEAGKKLEDTADKSSIEAPRDADIKPAVSEAKAPTTKESKESQQKPDSNGSAHRDTAPAGHTVGSKAASAGKGSEKASTSKNTTRPITTPVIKTASAAKPAPKPAKSPVPKTPSPQKSPTKARSSSKPPEKKTSNTPGAAPGPSKHSQAPSTASATKTKSHSPPPQTGFVKPKSRSPTRPVKLPASLTAPTASSGSKTALASSTNKQSSLTTTRGTSSQSTVRPTSRASLTSATKSAEVKSSTAKKVPSRPSLGPPPSSLKKQSSRQSLHSAAPLDEGFLARMMRPTTSSASKATEKHPVTPPKRDQSSRRSIRGDTKPSNTAPKMAKLTSTTNHAENVPKIAFSTVNKPKSKARVIKTAELPALEITQAEAEEEGSEAGNVSESQEGSKASEEDIDHSITPVPETVEHAEEPVGDSNDEGASTEEPSEPAEPEATENEHKEEVEEQAAELTTSEEASKTGETNEIHDSNEAEAPELEAIKEDTAVEEKELAEGTAIEQSAGHVEASKENV